MKKFACIYILLLFAGLGKTNACVSSQNLFALSKEASKSTALGFHNTDSKKTIGVLYIKLKKRFRNGLELRHFSISDQSNCFVRSVKKYLSFHVFHFFPFRLYFSNEKRGPPAQLVS